MSWARLASAAACSFCDQHIAPGQPVRRSTVPAMRRIRWCASCAKARLDEDVPTDVPDAVAVTVAGVQQAWRGAPPERSRPTARFESFNRTQTGAQLRANILRRRRDGRMAATGEQGR